MEFWLASYPRSGNTYFRILLRNRYGIPSYDQECPGDQETATLRNTKYARANYRDPEPKPVTGLKTHKPPEPGDTRPAVYIVRDGRDALVSYAHFAMSFVYKNDPTSVTPEVIRNTIRDMILEPNSLYKRWGENVEAWAARKNTTVFLFEDLIANPARVADRAMAALGVKLPLLSEEIPTFTELKSVDPGFFRKGQKGEWHEVFTPELYDLFWQHNGKTMLRFGYSHLPPLRKAA